jgi:hypothetical protein
MNNCCICWFSRIFLQGILIFKGLTARRLYKSFGIKGLSTHYFNSIKQYFAFHKLVLSWGRVDFIHVYSEGESNKAGKLSKN